MLRADQTRLAERDASLMSNLEHMIACTLIRCAQRPALTPQGD